MKREPEETVDSPHDAGNGSAYHLPEVYDELRRLAQFRMSQEGGMQTLSATALVHEAWMRISKDERTGKWANRRHFFGAAAEAMRRILIDRARARKQLKRGGDAEREVLEESCVIAPAKDEELLMVHEALEQLEAEDVESAELVKLRYFAGMTWEEISEATGTADRTIRRRWSYAKAWLREHISRNR